MAIRHLDANASPSEVASVVTEDGCVVIDRLAGPGALERVRSEMEPYLQATPQGPDDFTGQHTRRVGGLIARSPASHALILNDTVLQTVEKVLEKTTSFQIHLTQIIAIGAGESAQTIHRDQWAFDFFPFPAGFEAQCNTIWAMSDFTEENGATRVVVGSHRFEDKLRLTLEDTEPAEMEAGSALIYTGSLYHGGGQNRSDATRYGLNLTYARSWLRQEENQYLSVPLEIAKTLPRELQRLMGYARGAYALGYVDDLRDPMQVLRPDEAPHGFGDRPPGVGPAEQ